MNINTVKCNCCGEEKNKEYTVKANKKFVCLDCMNNKPPYYKNEKDVHKESSKGLTFQLSLECVPHSDEDKAIMLDSKYSLLPVMHKNYPLVITDFKTPTYYSLRGVKKMLRTLEKHADFKKSECFQTVSVGHSDYDYFTSRYGNEFYSSLFTPLEDVFSKDREASKRICGTNCGFNCVIDTDKISYPIFKMQSAEQYFNAVNMCGEITLQLVAFGKFCEVNYTDEKRISDKADMIAKKIVRIYKKYVDGKALCQREERNNPKK